MRRHILALGLPFAVLAHCSGSNPTDLFDAATPSDGSSGGDTTLDAVAACPAGKTRCGTACVDEAIDAQNCGGCGVTCKGTDICSASACVTCDKVDADQDGYNACVDCNDADPNVNPGAFDVAGNNIDDDCNGKPDDVVTCDANIASNSKDANDFAHAMDMCDPWVTAASFPTVADDRAHEVAPDWGAFKVQLGASMAALSNGIAADEDDPGYVAPQSGTNFGKQGTPYPLTPAQYTCIDANKQTQTFTDPSTVNDYTELSVSLKVPTNAHSFAIDLNYLTTDVPEWTCTQYDDQALVLLQSKAVTGDILLDATGHHMSANSDYLVVNDATSLAGTGMEIAATPGLAGGATGWMTLTAPATPGETITLRFVIFDTVDGVYDSQLLMDHFRWSTTKVCAPTTVDPLYDGGAPDGGC